VQRLLSDAASFVAASGVLAALCIVTALILAALCVTSPARGAELSLGRPSACAIGDELSFRAARALGRPLSEAGPARCTVHIVHDQGSLSARLEIESPGRPARLRSFRAPTCDELTDTLALAVVLALGAAEDASSEAGGGMSGSPPAVSPSGDGATAPSDARSTDRGATEVRTGAPPGAGAELHTALAAALVLDAGTLPALGIGPALAAAIGGDRFEARAIATWLPAREASIDPSTDGSAGADVGLVTGALLACVPHLAGPFVGSQLEFGACAGAELGWIAGSGVGVDAPESRGALWSAARLDLAGRYGLGPNGLGVELTLSGLLPLERHEFRIVDEVVHRPAPIVARVGLGLALELD